MVNKLKVLIRKHWDIISYLFFGVLTTLVNYIVYFPCYNWLRLSASVSNVIAWVFAVIFAYVTNKPFVFQSHDWSLKVVGPELVKFVGIRIGSGTLETLIIWVFADGLAFNGNWVKVFTSVLVVILNYVGSKLLVFRKKS